MLQSVKEERERRFKLAMRAGIPIIILMFLLFFTIFSKGNFTAPSLEDAILLGGLVFITVYFIYFLIVLDAKETLVDQTTEGFNLISFMSKIQKNQPKTVAILKIKNLSTINENYGIFAANTLLHTLVSKLNTSIHAHSKNIGSIGRYTGAEFLIAMDAETAEINLLLQEFIQDNQTIDSIEIDYAYAIIKNNNEEPQKNIERLKNILINMETKPNSKSHIKIKDASELSILEQQVIEALNRDDALGLGFRPLYSVKSGVIDIYEVTLKLLLKNGKKLSPKEYLPIINNHSLGVQYDQKIFEKIIQVLLLIESHISLSFNISPFSLRNQDFLENIFAMIDNSGIDPQRIIIEIYEKKAHHGLQNYLKILSKIRAKGVRICIDNFGTSNASMEYIKHFKFDLVQLDREFINTMDDPNHLSMLKSLITMSKDMDITTIVKWVDKAPQRKTLEGFGVDYIQGFSIGKLLSETELIAHYNRLK